MGTKRTIIWPPHVPILSYTAIASALLCTCLFIWQRLSFSVTPLQRSYITEYIRSEAGGTFNAHESYRLLYLGGGKGKPRLAFPVDFVAGKTELPNGKVVPVALSELATARDTVGSTAGRNRSWLTAVFTAGSARRYTKTRNCWVSLPSASSRAESAS